MTRPMTAHACAGLLVAFWMRRSAIRPFVSTDAAVADVQGDRDRTRLFQFRAREGSTTFISPRAVLNYGLIHNFEVVGEFAVEEPGHGSARLVDAALSVKAVLKEGVLQGKDGISFAIEAGPLLPSTNKEESEMISHFHAQEGRSRP